jgi:hypothetical protein
VNQPDDASVPPAPTPSGRPEPANVQPVAGDALAAVDPHLGRTVPWPPSPDQRGLAAPYPPGGADPEPNAGRREERFYLRLLVGMVLAIILGGFTISVIGVLLGVGSGT